MAKRIKLSASEIEFLYAWELRSDVHDLIGHWDRKPRPTFHSANGRCLRGFQGEHRDRAFLEASFTADRVAEQAGKARAFFYCTKCVLAYVGDRAAEQTQDEHEHQESASTPEPPTGSREALAAARTRNAKRTVTEESKTEKPVRQASKTRQVSKTEKPVRRQKATAVAS